MFDKNHDRLQQQQPQKLVFLLSSSGYIPSIGIRDVIAVLNLELHCYSAIAMAAAGFFLIFAEIQLAITSRYILMQNVALDMMHELFM